MFGWFVGCAFVLFLFFLLIGRWRQIVQALRVSTYVSLGTKVILALENPLLCTWD